MPVLHCELGTVKVQGFDNLVPYLLYLDIRTMEEDEVRSKLKQCNIQIAETKEHLPLVEQDYESNKKIQNKEQSKLTKARAKLKQKLKRACSSSKPDAGQQIHNVNQELDALNIGITSISQQKAKARTQIES